MSEYNDNIINTEKPLEYDFYETRDETDYNTIKSILNEYNQVSGYTISYYRQQDPNLNNDLIFMEKQDKKWCNPIKIKTISQYVTETIENARYGVPILDEGEFYFEKEYFKDKIKYEPKIGDLVKIEYANLMYQVVNVTDVDSIFWGYKLTWKLQAKIYHHSYEDEKISDEIIDPGWQSDEELFQTKSVNKQVEDKNDDLFTYDDPNKIFGNY